MASFWARSLTTYRVIFLNQPRFRILSLSDCTWTVTLLPWPSILLNKTLTRLKSSLCWNTIRRVFERKFGQRIEYFFRIQLQSTILSLSDCNWTVTLLPRPSFLLNRYLFKRNDGLGRSAEIPYSEVLSTKSDNVSSNFFVYRLGQIIFPLRLQSGSDTPP